MEELLIHIGYHKTATTWLQNELFISGNNVFEPLSLKTIGKSTFSWNFIIGKDGYLLSPFDDNREIIKKRLLEILVKKQHVIDKTFVMSSERLSGKPSAGGFDSKIIASRLHKIFPNAKILIVVREQKSFIKSLYFQYLSPFGAGVLSLKKYLNVKYDSIPLFSPHHLNFVPLIEEYQALFSKNQVLVLPYELFKADPNLFVKKLDEFLGKKIYIDISRFNFKHNLKSNKFVLYHFKFLNYFINSRSNNLHSSWHNPFTRKMARLLQLILEKVIPNTLNKWTERKVENYIKDWVGDRYLSANKELSQLIDFDLSQYNYH